MFSNYTDDASNSLIAIIEREYSKYTLRERRYLIAVVEILLIIYSRNQNTLIFQSRELPEGEILYLLHVSNIVIVDDAGMIAEDETIESFLFRRHTL